jgi:hypothetical protein
VPFRGSDVGIVQLQGERGLGGTLHLSVHAPRHSAPSRPPPEVGVVGVLQNGARLAARRSARSRGGGPLRPPHCRTPCVVRSQVTVLPYAMPAM